MKKDEKHVAQKIYKVIDVTSFKYSMNSFWLSGIMFFKMMSTFKRFHKKIFLLNH